MKSFGLGNNDLSTIVFTVNVGVMYLASYDDAILELVKLDMRFQRNITCRGCMYQA